MNSELELKMTFFMLTDVSINPTDMSINLTDVSINPTDVSINLIDVSINPTDVNINPTNVSFKLMSVLSIFIMIKGTFYSTLRNFDQNPQTSQNPEFTIK